MSDQFPSRQRTRGELSDAIAVTSPPVQYPTLEWDIDRIKAARGQQFCGQFALPTKLAIAMRSDDAIFPPRRHRLKSLSSLPLVIQAHDSTRGRAIAQNARSGVQVDQDVLNGIDGTLVDHGIAIGYLLHKTNKSGTRVDMRLTEWPLEYVQHDPYRNVLTTSTLEGPVVDIVHGNGRFIVFRDAHERPWIQDSCLLAASFLYPQHALALADWTGAINAHGLGKLLGELPPGVMLTDESGNPSPEAAAFLRLLTDIVTGNKPAGIMPSGSKAEFKSDGSTAWQVFSEFNNSRERAAARIYTGTDAILGTISGAPGIDISQLFGVTTTILQSATSVISRGLNSGLTIPWTALNVGDSRLAPSYQYQLPDPDEDQRLEQRAKNWARFCDTIAKLRDARFQVTDDLVARVAAEFKIDPAPTAADLDTATSTVVLAPTDVAKVVRAREARASQGLGPFGDARDEMTLPELDAKSQASSKQ